MVAILVLLTILALVAIDALLTWRQRATEPALPPSPIATGLTAGQFLHPGHGWVQVETGGRVQVGVDGFVRGAVGAPELVDARPVGAWLQQGQPMLTLERGGRHVHVPAPLTGCIEAVNPELQRHPGWWGGSRGDGWAYTLRPARLGSEIESLRVAEVAAGWLRGQTSRLSAWLTETAGAGVLAPTLPDGGTPVEGALDAFDARAWQDFEQVFLPTGTRWSWSGAGEPQ